MKAKFAFDVSNDEQIYKSARRHEMMQASIVAKLIESLLDGSNTISFTARQQYHSKIGPFIDSERTEVYDSCISARRLGLRTPTARVVHKHEVKAIPEQPWQAKRAAEITKMRENAMMVLQPM